MQDQECLEHTYILEGTDKESEVLRRFFAEKFEVYPEHDRKPLKNSEQTSDKVRFAF